MFWQVFWPAFLAVVTYDILKKGLFILLVPRDFKYTLTRRSGQ